MNDGTLDLEKLRRAKRIMIDSIPDSPKVREAWLRAMENIVRAREDQRIIEALERGACYYRGPAIQQVWWDESQEINNWKPTGRSINCGWPWVARLVVRAARVAEKIRVWCGGGAK